MLQKILLQIYCYLYSSNNPEKIITQLFLTLIIIIFFEQLHIKMISEGSCDTDWRNDAENSALITGINYILQNIS